MIAPHEIASLKDDKVQGLPIRMYSFSDLVGGRLYLHMHYIYNHKSAVFTYDTHACCEQVYMCKIPRRNNNSW